MDISEYHDILYNCKKPYQYVGGEYLSFNKSFDEAKVRFALAFPDKYEIGISNLGVRVLYGMINRQPNYMADRVYAPEVDFQEAIVRENKPLYALESKRLLKEFDVIGFSLQYELAYPTVLKMLDMSSIPIKSADRGEDCPIIVAGGPCTFNPLPMRDFIDAFSIGDGEEALIDICKVIESSSTREEKLEKLSKIDGIYVPKYHNGQKIKKRIVQINYDNALKSYPIPFSSSVHDRATIEIRRGCGRMCRFCQPGHVTLPIRERSAEDIIKISKELVDNTGYDEYSLLSLSSNDYSNIKEVIKELSCDFNNQRVSVSLPSQRIDGFSTELANLVQGVRKSTMTLAPEAGSQRLRNVIRKNITQDQILNATLSLYENGWSKVKFYFITGLPTETYQDIDETANLFYTIKNKAKEIKKTKGLTHSLDITCTFSIFVPKPFTPFQWCGQMNLEEVGKRIKYLKEKTKNIKGLKINYHEKSISQIEAVLTRGDSSLCEYIEKLYEKGCYLDAWNEHFKEDVWHETAKELGFSLEKRAERKFELDEELPWSFIDTGLDKNWLKNEYLKAMKDSEDIQPCCERGCVNCGVCKNLKTKKILAKPYKSTGTIKNKEYSESFKYRLQFTKKGVLRYFSHLDWQNTFLKALKRTKLPICYSNGFNPMMKVSLGIALPLFMESECELADIELFERISPEDFKNKLKLPTGCEILSIKEIPLKSESIDHYVAWAKYRIKIDVHKMESLRYNAERVLNSQEIILEKKNKKGILKKTNVKPSIKEYYFDEDALFITLKAGQGEDIPSLRADDLMKIIMPDDICDIKRTEFYDRNNVCIR